MEWKELSRSIDQAKLISNITALSFDPYYDLLWTGNGRGRVYSSCSVSLDRYSSTLAATSPVVGLLVDDKGVVALAHDSIRMTTRQGLVRWSLEKNDELRFLRSMCFTGPASTEIIAAGEQQEALFVSATSGHILRRVAVDDSVAVLKASEGSGRMTICGTGNGKLSLRDPKTFKVEHSVQAHLGGLTDIVASGNLIATAGYSLRHGQPTFDPLVKIYDQRNLKSLAPVPFPAGPSLLRRHPKLSSTIIVAANSGHWQIIDLLNPANTRFFQAESTGLTTCLDISPTGEAIAFGDNQGLVSLWGKNTEVTFSSHGQRPPLAAEKDVPLQMGWSPTTPSNSVGMPYYDEPLLSAWPPHIYDITTRPPKIDPDVLAKMKMVDFVGYAPNPKKYRRNQINVRKSQNDGPKFRSEKEKDMHSRRKDIVTTEPTTEARAIEESKKSQGPPQSYKKVEIKYSKFGIEDFDFAFYNATSYSGLETHIVNSYTNALLQVLHYITPIRQLCISHIRKDCLLQDCLSCELGFLFRMLEDGKGQNCQASNFLKTFSRIPKASALGLFDREDSHTRESYAAIIQNFNRFILEHLNSESNMPNDQLQDSNHLTIQPSLTQILGLEAETLTRCPCGSESSRTTTSFTIDMLYPRKAMSNEQPIPSDFLTVLSGSITRASSSRAWCAACKKYQMLQTGRVPKRLPPILSINTMVNTADQAALWRKGHYLEESFRLESRDGRISALEDGSQAKDDKVDSSSYELVGFVLQVESEEKEGMHLVSLVKMESQNDQDGERWYLFNDFLVKEVSAADALDFTLSWKMPAVLYYRRKGGDEILNLADSPTQTNSKILYENGQRIQEGVQPLSPNEELGKRTLIAIDAEFVALEQEEFEIHSDGTKSIVRPSVLSLARVSVLRGQGQDRGVPFIDDYIRVTEPVVDYLTEFSGIHPGDLDPQISKKVVVPLKEVYRKLRLLIDLGCIFVGHGLKKDFRIMNLLVPSDQILDTVEIYHLPSRHRKVSLRFLAWFLFGRDIQPESGGGHDSVVDARTALECLVKYYDLLEEGRREEEWYDAVTPLLETLYDKGRALGWKPQVQVAL